MPDLEPGRIRLWWWSAPSLVRAAPALGGAALLVAFAWPRTPPPAVAAIPPVAVPPAAEAPVRPAPPPSSAPPVRTSVAKLGERCPKPGERAVTKAGTALRCVRKPGERRAVWRAV